jgi:hypothetical protein
MKNLLILVSAAMACAILGCSQEPQKTVAQSAPTAVVQASASPASTSPVAEPEAALPVPAVGQTKHQAWHLENVKEQVGDAVALKVTSLDGKYDLVILEVGSHPFVSFARHSHWESVHNQPGKGKLMYLRAKFEDGPEQRMEWDELGYGTENLHVVLWSYPGKKDAPLGPVAEGATSDSVGGDELLLQEMMKHKAMLLEVEPGVTTQFDLTGLAQETQKLRAPKAQPILEARQDAE